MINSYKEKLAYLQHQFRVLSPTEFLAWMSFTSQREYLEATIKNLEQGF